MRGNSSLLPHLFFCLFRRFAWQTHLQRIQFTDFISHLTNSNGCGNLRLKVLMTVSPLPPFRPPQPRGSPRAPLPTHHSPASRTSPLCVLRASVANPIFSPACRPFASPTQVNP